MAKKIARDIVIGVWKMKQVTKFLPIIFYRNKGAIYQDPTLTPGGRQSSSTWTDKDGNMWLFGGILYELSTPSKNITINCYQ